MRVIGLRRGIAGRMQESKRRIPHFTYVEEIDMTELEALRAHLNRHDARTSPSSPCCPSSCARWCRSCPTFPQINACFDDEAGVVHRYSPVHIGIATQTGNGLIVPVVRHAETLRSVGAPPRSPASPPRRATDKATKEDLSGSTITITSLGPLGGV